MEQDKRIARLPAATIFIRSGSKVVRTLRTPGVIPWLLVLLVLAAVILRARWG